MLNEAPSKSKLEEEVAHFLATGDSDPLGGSFPGRHALERLNGYERHLRKSLLNEVRQREQGRRQIDVPAGLDATASIGRKVEPMITGFFPAAEWQVVLEMAGRSIVFLTREATHRLLRDLPYLESAWTIANIYLHSLRAPLLSDGNSLVVGMSEEPKCYVSLEYFAEKDPFADYVVHEVAHIFHNCKCKTLGLPRSRSKEWLLDIAFAKRETFAYACEVYSRILEQSRSPGQRSELFAQYSRRPKLSDDRADHDELIDILKEAVAARNGWRRILSRCSNRKPM